MVSGSFGSIWHTLDHFACHVFCYFIRTSGLKPWNSSSLSVALHFLSSQSGELHPWLHAGARQLWEGQGGSSQSASWMNRILENSKSFCRVFVCFCAFWMFLKMGYRCWMENNSMKTVGENRVHLRWRRVAKKPSLFQVFKSWPRHLKRDGKRFIGVETAKVPKGEPMVGDVVEAYHKKRRACPVWVFHHIPWNEMIY